MDKTNIFSAFNAFNSVNNIKSNCVYLSKVLNAMTSNQPIEMPEEYSDLDIRNLKVALNFLENYCGVSDVIHSQIEDIFESFKENYFSAYGNYDGNIWESNFNKEVDNMFSITDAKRELIVEAYKAENMPMQYNTLYEALDIAQGAAFDAEETYEFAEEDEANELVIALNFVAEWCDNYCMNEVADNLKAYADDLNSYFD